MRKRWWLVPLCLLAQATRPLAADDAPLATEVVGATPGGHRTLWGAPALPRQWNPHVPGSPALEVPSAVTRDEHEESVTLKEAIGLALQNNPGVAAQRLEPGRSVQGVLQAQAQYDPTASGEVTSTQTITPNVSSLSSTTVTVNDDRTANFHLFKLFRPGTQITVDSLNERIDNNSSFIALRPEYKPGLNVSIVQPLLRNFGWDFSYLVVRVAEQTADAAVYAYEAQLADFVQQVIEAYWAVVGARETVTVQRESLELANRTVDENQARVRVGLLPPVATLEAQADAKSREEQVIIAENNLAVARQRLAQLAFYRPEGTFVPRTLEPRETAVPEEVAVDLDAALAEALARRPEIVASARGLRAQQLNERIAENGLLPRLDLVGSYGVNAVSGVAVTTVRTRTSISGSACRPDGTTGFFICSVPPSPFAGGVGEAYDRLNGFRGDDFRSYSFGVKVEVPLSNALARSQAEQSRIALSQSELNHRQLLSNVTLEVRQGAADVTAARQRIDTTRIARELADENLRNQHKRHEVGMATTKDLLDFQTRLTTARAAEVQAKIDHALAVARWRRARGQLLEHFQIVLERPGHGSTPWFARF